jgi:hypothetical protein
LSEEKTSPRRSPIILFTVISIILLLSIVFLFYAFEAFANSGFYDGLWLAVIGILGLVVSTYGFSSLRQTQKEIPQLILKPKKVLTEVLCQKCGFKNVRDFKHGDYILQDSEKCPKCDEKMIIDAIYREVKENEKDET